MQTYDIYNDLAKQNHLLIAGATGSGKSVLENAIMFTLLQWNVRFILLDPKRVELVDYRDLPHTLYYSCTQDDMIAALEYALFLTEQRYSEMQMQGVKLYNGPDVWVVVDELADLMTTCRKEAQPMLQRLLQIGRAARIHVLLLTQTPIVRVIPTELKCNCDVRIGLRCACAQDSRNIIGVRGCEELPDPKVTGKGYGYIRNGADIQLYQFPMIPEEDIREAISRFPKKKPVKKQREHHSFWWYVKDFMAFCNECR